ncbi:MAG: cytochrome c3 family protein [Planctomycetota bacterium]
MHCHHELYTDAAALAPVRESWRAGTPIAWRRVHVLPDHVFFDHSVHVRAGLECSECHGAVERMPRITQVAPLDMGWCLDCHRQQPRAARLSDCSVCHR